MRIVTLQTKDFRGLENGLHSFEMDNLISGRNGTGKSSIADAIIFALYGRTRTGNLAVDVLINESSESTTVAVEFDTGTTVVREESRFYGTRIQLSGETIDQKSLEANLPDYKTFLSIFLPGYFTEQSEAEQRSGLLNYSAEVNLKELFSDYTHKPELLDRYMIDFTNLDKESKKYRADEKSLKDMVSTNEQRRTFAEEQIKSIKKPKARIDVDKVTAELEAHEAWEAHEHATEVNDRVGKQILAATKGTCETCHQELPEDQKKKILTDLGKQRLETTEPKAKKPKATVWELREKLSDAKAVNALYDNYEEQVLDLEATKVESTGKIDKAKAQLIEISIIVDALSAGGIRAQAARKQIIPITDAINEFLDDKMKISIETLKQLKTKSDMKEVFIISMDNVPFTRLSTGERKRIEIAISQAINKLSEADVNMYFVDDAELISEPYSLTGQVFKAYVTDDEALTITEG